MIRGAKTLALVAAAFIGGALTGARGLAEDEDPYGALSVFARVLGYIERSYVEQISVERLVGAAIRGMIAQLDGPSAYLDPEAFAALRAEARPDFGGVGVVLTERSDRVVVVQVDPETPADQAGVDPGDVLLEVDGWSVQGRSLTSIVERITGVPGTTVNLAFEPGDGSAVRLVQLVRARIFRSSVTARRFGGLGYLRILQFEPRTSLDVVRALRTLKEGEALAGLVVDVRGNPGGVLDQAVATADLWLKDGLIVTTAGRARERESATARDAGTEPDYPVAVLVDEGTASAAEILAGALQDRGRGKLFGRQTFGKGSVQTLIELEDGSALKLTVARYLTPSGRSIQGVGISPDVELPPTEAGFRFGAPRRDATLARALGWLSRRTGRSAGLETAAAEDAR